MHTSCFESTGWLGNAEGRMGAAAALNLSVRLAPPVDWQTGRRWAGTGPFTTPPRMSPTLQCQVVASWLSQPSWLLLHITGWDNTQFSDTTSCGRCLIISSEVLLILKWKFEDRPKDLNYARSLMSWRDACGSEKEVVKHSVLKMWSGCPDHNETWCFRVGELLLWTVICTSASFNWGGGTIIPLLSEATLSYWPSMQIVLALFFMCVQLGQDDN